MARRLKDPEMVRYGQLKANVNGYVARAFETTWRHFKLGESEMTHMWLMEPEHPLTIRTRAYFYAVLEKQNAGLVAEFWSQFSSV
jgi:hypothetical protein